MSGGVSSSSGSSKKSSSSNDRKMNGDAALIMLVIIAILGGYHAAKGVRNLGGKRQAEINRLWRVSEAQRVIREHDEETEARLKAQFDEIPS